MFGTVLDQTVKFFCPGRRAADRVTRLRVEPIVGVLQRSLARQAQAARCSASASVSKRMRARPGPAGIQRSAFAIGVERPELLLEARDLGATLDAFAHGGGSHPSRHRVAGTRAHRAGRRPPGRRSASLSAELLRCFGQVIDVHRHLLHGSRSVAGASIVAIERSVDIHSRSHSLGPQAPAALAAWRPRRRGIEKPLRA
jgi:hypothetical protein